MNGMIYLFTRLFQSPLEALFTLLIFIMAKELHATPLQLTLLVSAKPTVSLVAYITSLVFANKGYLKKPFLLTISALSSISCLSFPFIDNNWFYIASYALFMISLRSSSPIWIECLKTESRFTKFLARGSSLNYAMLIVVPMIAAYFMDENGQIWKMLFCFGGMIQLLNLIGLCFLQINESSDEAKPVDFKQSLRLLRDHRPFIKYQLLFFLGGIGLVAIQPILPIYFTDGLSLSYKEFVGALSICRGLAFVMTAPLWVRFLNRSTLYHLSIYFNLISVFFIGFLLIGTESILWIYTAYLLYGSMQSGCELTWNYSGAYFAKEKESLTFTGVNHLFIGLRGMVAPFVGQMLFAASGFTGVFIFSGVLSLVSAMYAYQLGKSSEAKSPLISTQI